MTLVTCFLFYKTFSPIFVVSSENQYLNEVSGVSLIIKSEEHVLNFDQQIDLLHALKVQKALQWLENIDFEKIIIYRFDKSDLILEKDQLCLNNL